MKTIKINVGLLIVLLAFFGCTKEMDMVEIEYEVTAVVVPDLTSFTGECPKKFEFGGEITVNAPVTVTYTWLRSDGATGPEETLEFTEAGSKTVSTSWTLGGAGESYEGYWHQLKVISPVEILSDKAEFDLFCEEDSEISATATVDGDSEFTGECPKKFDFTGEITANKAMTITYTWLRSDGATSPEETLEFTEAGSKTVSKSWTLGSAGESYEGYWQQLKVISPAEILSDKAEFDLFCEGDTEISATATVEGDSEFTGECPKKFDFTGEITVNEAMTVTYTWLRSDGATAPEKTLEFTEAGSKTVSTSWTLGGAGEAYEGYWQQLKVISPAEILSDKAEFDLFCEEDTEISATATVEGNSEFTGECPKKFDFTGEITANKAMTVTYTWLRSDGATGPEETLEFTEAGSKTVSTSWTLGGAGESYEGYWHQLKVISPAEILSDKAEFDLFCEEDTEISATATVEGDSEFTGECPKKFDFTGEITANKAMTVTYTWLRSDGATGPEETLEFTEAGSKTVSTSWTLGGAGESYEGYWQQLKVITPEEILSEKVEFDLHCEQEIEEDCVSFDYNNLTVLESGGKWFIRDGSHQMMAFRTSAKAELAVAIMKHYKMTKYCFAIRPNPGLSYLTIEGALPVGSYSGEDCLPINPNDLTIRKNSETSYSILDNGTIPFHARSLEEAQKIVALVEKYQPKYTCYVERPDPGMVYLRK